MLRRTLKSVEKRSHSERGMHSEFSPGAMCTRPKPDIEGSSYEH